MFQEWVLSVVSQAPHQFEVQVNTRFFRTKSRIVKRLLPVAFALIVFLSLSDPLYAAVESKWGWIETIGRWFNLAVLFGVIIYFVREPLSDFFRRRRHDIHLQLEEANRARREAEEKLAAIEAKMENLEAEVEEIHRDARSEVEAERQRILRQAEVEAERIVRFAEREIEVLTRAARRSLKDYAVDLSVKLAADKIRSKVDDRIEEHVVERFFVNLTGEKKH